MTPQSFNEEYVAELNRGWKRGDPIGYMPQDIPEFELPPYEGDRYEALVPDTLDLQQRAALAINGLTEPTDPLADYELYWKVWFRSNPPSMILRWWHSTGQAKSIWATLLMRLASGSEQNLHVEHRWMEVALRCQGPDGLIYSPIRGRPWAFPSDIMTRKLDSDQFVMPMGNATMLSAMALLARRDSGSVWTDALRRLVDGVIGLAVDAGDHAYFYPSVLEAAPPPPTGGEVPTGQMGAEQSVVPQGLVYAYRVLGYEPALTLAGKFINYLRQNFYTPDGSFLTSLGDPHKAHFHAHSRGLLAMEEYAEVADDQELMQFVVHSFEWARDQGDRLTGFFPEHVNARDRQTGETCQVADMIAVALRFSEAGLGDYWDDADRWIRNQLAENQLLSIDWVDRFAAEGPATVPADNLTMDRVAERNVGAFAGWPSPNDWHPPWRPSAIMHCCTVNGAKTLYWIWERIVRYQAGKLRVNLLLNRASKWADVDSHIPYAGQVDVKIKEPVELSVRIPEWVTPSQVRVQVNGEDRRVGWEGRYAQVGAVKPGDVASLTFPIAERTDTVWIEKREYELVRKGNEVVAIAPPGEVCPLYQRDHYRENTTRWRKIERFVSNEQME